MNGMNENIAFTALPLSVYCTSSHLPCFNFKALGFGPFHPSLNGSSQPRAGLMWNQFMRPGARKLSQPGP